MRGVRLLVVLAALGGCAGSARSTVPASADRRTPEVDTSTLEARLAEREREVRELRETLATRDTVVRIGGPTETPTEGAPIDAVVEDVPAEPVAQSDTSPRPVLRLHGMPAPPAGISSPVIPAIAAIPGPDAPPVVAAPPRVPITDGRLASLALPTVPGDVPAIPEAPLVVAPPVAFPSIPTPSPVPNDPAAREYQTALAHLEARRFAEADASLARFLSAHADHAYADNALYWRGELRFLARDYRAAVTIYESLVARYPRGNRVADALLRAGVCLERLGDNERARGFFRRVRDEFPNTVAARMASREET